MNFFDEILSSSKNVYSSLASKSYAPNKPWQDVGRNEVILQRDSAYELNGVGYNIVTSKDIGADEIIVVGDDLRDIKKEQRFARISIIQIDDVDDEQKAYNLIRKIEYQKYHFFPRGYMIRSSSRNHNEIVRVSKSALKAGLDFQGVGSLLIDKYKENSAVKAVKVIFITDKSADYDKLQKLSEKNYDITETLNHVMQNVKFDCDSCRLKVICDEVEGMKELHFKNAGM